MAYKIAQFQMTSSDIKVNNLVEAFWNEISVVVL